MNGDSAFARSGTGDENSREVHTPERAGVPITVSAPATMDTAKLRWHFFAFGSLLRRKEIVHDERQLEIEEVRFSLSFSCNGMQQR